MEFEYFENIFYSINDETLKQVSIVKKTKTVKEL